MAEDFFNVPFNEDTNVKLDLYERYVREWLPVFIGHGRTFVDSINIFDFFCGPGMDPNGTLGSPLIALKVLNEYWELVNATSLPINLYFNDANPKYIKTLSESINRLGYNKSKINIVLYNEDFVSLFPETLSLMDGAANLIFLDQFGVKYVSKERFNTLINLRFTDVIFFISSSTFNRFPDDPNVTDVIGLNSDQIKSEHFYDIHRLVHKKYTELIPSNVDYYLAPFSIKKGSNIYGLIFGSGHPLGMEKFLDICWEMDKETGEANFDIQGDKSLKYQGSLFPEDHEKTKIAIFQSNLRQGILEGKLSSDLELYLHTIKNGFTGIHIRPVISQMKTERLIKLLHPSFKCNVVYKSDRQAKKIDIL